MCSSGIAWVRAGEQTIWKRHRLCVGEGCESERERASEGERGLVRGEREVVCVQKWRIDRETMLMLFESGLCTETQGKPVIVCVIGTS